MKESHSARFTDRIRARSALLFRPRSKLPRGRDVEAELGDIYDYIRASIDSQNKAARLGKEGQ